MSTAAAAAVAIVASVALIAASAAHVPPVPDRREQISRACSSRWKDDLVNHRDVDAGGNLTGSGSRKVRCRGACGLLVPPQDVAACVVAGSGRPLSARDARRAGLGGRPVPVCADCRMKSPPPPEEAVARARPIGPVELHPMLSPGVRRFPLERMGGFVPAGPAVGLVKVTAAHAGNLHGVVTLDDPAPGEDGYDGSAIGDAMASLRAKRIKLTDAPLPTGGTPRPDLDLADGMTREDRAEAMADHDEAAAAYAAEERTLADAIAAIRLISPDGHPPAAPRTDRMADAERAAAEQAHEVLLADYKAAMHNFYERTQVNRAEGEQAWRRSRGRRPGPAAQLAKQRLREPA